MHRHEIVEPESIKLRQELPRMPKTLCANTFLESARQPR